MAERCSRGRRWNRTTAQLGRLRRPAQQCIGGRAVLAELGSDETDHGPGARRRAEGLGDVVIAACGRECGPVVQGIGNENLALAGPDGRRSPRCVSSD